MVTSVDLQTSPLYPHCLTGCCSTTSGSASSRIQHSGSSRCGRRSSPWGGRSCRWGRPPCRSAGSCCPCNLPWTWWGCVGVALVFNPLALLPASLPSARRDISRGKLKKISSTKSHHVVTSAPVNFPYWIDLKSYSGNGKEHGLRRRRRCEQTSKHNAAATFATAGALL